MNKVTKDIFYVGVNDHIVDLFEGQYVVPNGMSYNSYIIKDEKIAVMDTVDKNFTHEWLDNIKDVLGADKPDYLVVQHMEPDHSANIMNFFGNVFGGRHGGYHKDDDNNCCSLIWIILLLSVCGCGNSFNICDIFNNDCFMLILLLILLSNCGCDCGHDMGGCRG